MYLGSEELGARVELIVGGRIDLSLNSLHVHVGTVVKLENHLDMTMALVEF